MRWPFIRRRRRDIPSVVRGPDGTFTRPQDALRWADFFGGRGGEGRLSFIGRMVRRALGLARVEHRAITELPWNVGGSRWTRTVGSIEQSAEMGALFAAGRLLANSISSLPLHTYRTEGKVRIRLPDAPLFAKPAIHGGRRRWLFQCMTSLVYTGNAIGLITNRDGLGMPLRIEWLYPSEVQVDDRQASGRGSYMDPIWRWRGVEVPTENIVHIPWFPIPWRVLGLSPITAYAASWYAAMSAQEYIGDWFTNGGVPPGRFKNIARRVSLEEGNKIKALLVAAMRGHEPLVYGKDWDFEPFMVKPQDAMFIELLKLTATDIAAIYGIPAEKIGGQTAGNLTYQTVELQGIDYLQFTLLGWITLLEDAFFDLLPRPRFVKFNVDALIRPDTQTRHEVYRIDREIGLRSIDELRALEDELPLPDGQGASYAPLQVQIGAANAPSQPPIQREQERERSRVDPGQLILPFTDLPVPSNGGKALGH